MGFSAPPKAAVVELQCKIIFPRIDNRAKQFFLVHELGSTTGTMIQYRGGSSVVHTAVLFPVSAFFFVAMNVHKVSVA